MRLWRNALCYRFLNHCFCQSMDSFIATLSPTCSQVHTYDYNPGQKWWDTCLQMLQYWRRLDLFKFQNPLSPRSTLFHPKDIPHWNNFNIEWGVGVGVPWICVKYCGSVCCCLCTRLNCLQAISQDNECQADIIRGLKLGKRVLAEKVNFEVG